MNYCSAERKKDLTSGYMVSTDCLVIWSALTACWSKCTVGQIMLNKAGINKNFQTKKEKNRLCK